MSVSWHAKWGNILTIVATHFYGPPELMRVRSGRMRYAYGGKYFVQEHRGTWANTSGEVGGVYTFLRMHGVEDREAWLIERQLLKPRGGKHQPISKKEFTDRALVHMVPPEAAAIQLLTKVLQLEHKKRQCSVCGKWIRSQSNAKYCSTECARVAWNFMKRIGPQRPNP